MRIPSKYLAITVDQTPINKCWICKIPHESSRVTVVSPQGDRLHMCSMECFDLYSEIAKNAGVGRRLSIENRELTPKAERQLTPILEKDIALNTLKLIEKPVNTEVVDSKQNTNEKKDSNDSKDKIRFHAWV